MPLILLSGLAGLAALDSGSSGSGDDGANAERQEVIQDDTHFYGDSPPVYPSRKSQYEIETFSTKNALADMTGRGSWAIAFDKARHMVGNMTLEEKASINHIDILGRLRTDCEVDRLA